MWNNATSTGASTNTGTGGTSGGFLDFGSNSNGATNTNGGTSAGTSGSSGEFNLNGEIDNTLFDMTGGTEKIRYYQDLYMGQLAFSDTDFEDLYYRRKLFTSAEVYFAAVGRSVATAAAIKNNMSFTSELDLFSYYLRFLAANTTTFSTNLAAGFPASTINLLRNYIKVGFKHQEASDIFSNSSLWVETNTFLNNYGNQAYFNNKLNTAMSDPTGTVVTATQRVERLKAFIRITNAFKSELTQLAQQDRTFITSGGDMNILMRIFGKVLGKKIGKVIPFVGTAVLSRIYVGFSTFN